MYTLAVAISSHLRKSLTEYAKVCVLPTASLVLLLSGTTSYAESGEAQKYSFTLKTTRLPDMLLAIGKITESTIAFAHKEIENIESGEINGSYSVSEALDIAVQYCDCEIKKTGKNAFVVTIKQNDTSNKDDAVIEEIVITGVKQTGSHLFRQGTYNNSSLIELNHNDIETTSSSSLHDLLKYNPVVTGATTSTSVSNGGDGSASVTLRGLPADTTLVLVDGQRIAPRALQSELVDLYSIPYFSVESVEIFKDGTSAIYGSDAIAGTVNVILQKRLHGFDIEQYYGETSREDMKTNSTTIKAGFNNDIISLYASAFTFDQEAIYSKDRELSSSADTTDIGGRDNRSVFTPYSFIYLVDGSSILVEDQYDPPNVRYTTADDLYNFHKDTTSTSPSDRYGFYTYNSLQISPELSADLSYFHMSSKSTIEFSPVPVNTSKEQYPLTVSAENIHNIFQANLGKVTRRINELSNREQFNSTLSDFVKVSLSQTLDNQQWSLAYHYSETDSKKYSTNLVDGFKLQRGIGPSSGCQGIDIDGCVPINFIGGPGSITPEQASYIGTTSTVTGESILQSLNFDYGWDLNQDHDIPLLLATGFEFREEKSIIEAQHNAKTSFIIGENVIPNQKGERDIRELYGEMEYSPSILPYEIGTAIEFAFRYSHYDDFGENIAPRIGLRINPTENLTLRSSYSESFDAPSLRELYTEGRNSYFKISDPCAIAENVGRLPGCRVQSFSNSNQVLVESNGNLDLEPEDANSTNVGIMWRNGGLNSFFIQLDYHYIDQNNVIHPINPQYLVYQNAIGADVPLVERNQIGELIKVNTTYFNFGFRELTSYDAALGFEYSNRDFTTRFSFNTTYIDKYTVGSKVDTFDTDLSGKYVDVFSGGHGALPKWKHNTSLVLSYKGSQIAYSNLYVDSMTETPTAFTPKREIDSWLIHNIQFQQSMFSDQVKLFLGVDNILDTEPPFSITAFNDNFDARTYDIRGRYFYAKLKISVQ
ncbi:TonB-dependent receptor domain-containing protein [Teredinibacter sp. KSP-S5-2]|uniref:TonB-dependent receptor domain-containing protein n=1 Tax=Teredinibacter sp. KSP-S5-2 TaxID=3034506 RepID=UPI0029341A56|nr:TonB-dependent receptor [Teredinibacter sp. KSP-S5-2]WNO07646.1 TonB-dependent receptor [Teredinibacter sp. KSP-S5-2]